MGINSIKSAATLLSLGQLFLEKYFLAVFPHSGPELLVHLRNTILEQTVHLPVFFGTHLEVPHVLLCSPKSGSQLPHLSLSVHLGSYQDLNGARLHVLFAPLIPRVQLLEALDVCDTEDEQNAIFVLDVVFGHGAELLLSGSVIGGDEDAVSLNFEGLREDVEVQSDFSLVEKVLEVPVEETGFASGNASDGRHFELVVEGLSQVLHLRGNDLESFELDFLFLELGFVHGFIRGQKRIVDLDVPWEFSVVQGAPELIVLLQQIHAFQAYLVLAREGIGLSILGIEFLVTNLAIHINFYIME